jgi:hypothetical protein
MMGNELLALMAAALVLTVLAVWLIAAARADHESGTDLKGTLVETYPDKGVQVTVDWQGYEVKVLRLPQAALEEMQSVDDEFKPRRLLLNVVVARADDADRLVTRFDPPLQLEIAYSLEDGDIARKRNLDYPQLGFWDGCKWVLFRAEKHGLKYMAAEKPTAEVAGHAHVTLHEWSDPSIGAGPP